MANWSETEGSPQPLGATWLKEEKSYNFSLYSRHASGVTLLLYTARDLVNPVLRVSLNHLTHKSGRIWHCRLKADEVANASYYAYSVEGANTAEGELRSFDPDKVLLDPYARSIFFPPTFGVVLRSDADRMPEERLSARFQSMFQRLTGAQNLTLLTGAENPTSATRQTPSSMKCMSEGLPTEIIPGCPGKSGEHLQELLRKFPISKSLELPRSS